MTFLPGSKGPEIVRLFNEGLPPIEIGPRVGCSRSNAHKTLRRHVASLKLCYTRISPLSSRDMDWLQAEAQRLKTTTPDLARAMLVDAIAEARDGEC